MISLPRSRRFLIFIALLSLIAASCGGGDESADTTATSSTTTSTEAAVVEEATDVPDTTTTTTAAPPAAGPVMPFSGEPLDGDAPSHGAVVVKISNNDDAARQALSGLDQADIVFEERIEQEATRFAAVFHSSLPTEVGSVRSGRTSDVQIVANLGVPVFAFSGANDGVHAQLRDAENNGLIVRSSADFGDSEFSRISSASAPNNLVADVQALAAKGQADTAPTPIMSYANNVLELGVPSAGVSVEQRTPASFVWDADLGAYRRYDGSTPAMTREDIPIAPTNVVILTTTYVPSRIDASSVDALTVGSGRVDVYSNGYVVQGTWTREFERDPYTLVTTDGQEIGLAPGQTWISLAPVGTGTELSQQAAQEFG